jgi:membrane fusion protein (multidrug efflux system)
MTHTFPVIITVDNREGRLGGGELVRATLSLDEKFTSLAVTKDAVVRQGSQTFLYTVVDGKAVNIPITTGSSNGSFIAVSGEGVTENMAVVVRGNERIFPGSPVQVEGEIDKTSTNPDSEAASEQNNSKSGEGSKS